MVSYSVFMDNSCRGKVSRNKEVTPMFCVYCGVKLNDQATFCSNCGRQIRREATPVVLECLSCHARNPDDAVYCWNCGRPLKRDEALLPFTLPGAIASTGPAVGNAPMVQGTPQMGNVPSVQGAPQMPGSVIPGNAAPHAGFTSGHLSGNVASSGSISG